MTNLSEKIRANALKGQLLNPLRGLLPLLVLMISDIFLSFPLSLCCGIVAAVVMLVYNRLSDVHGFQRIITLQTFIFSVAFFLSFVIKTQAFVELYADALAIFTLLILYVLKSWLKTFFIAKHPHQEGFIGRSFVQFYFVSKIVVLIAIIRIVLFIVFRDFIASYDWLEITLNILLILIVSVLFFVETYKLSFFRQKLAEEEFLPVVDAKGAVVGKMVKSEMGVSAEKQLHPIVRMFFIDDDSIFLQKENFCDPRSSDYWDASADTHVCYGETMEDALRRSVRCMCMSDDIKPSFLLKYVYKTDKEEHLVFLYYVKHASQIEMAKQTDFFGKFWPLWQIDANMGQQVFSPQFEMEYEYFKNTVFVGKRM
jgi:hypothetical protein